MVDQINGTPPIYSPKDFAKNIRQAWDIESSVQAISDALLGQQGIEEGLLNTWTDYLILTPFQSQVHPTTAQYTMTLQLPIQYDSDDSPTLYVIAGGYVEIDGQYSSLGPLTGTLLSVSAIESLYSTSLVNGNQFAFSKAEPLTPKAEFTLTFQLSTDATGGFEVLAQQSLTSNITLSLNYIRLAWSQPQPKFSRFVGCVNNV